MIIIGVYFCFFFLYHVQELSQIPSDSPAVHRAGLEAQAPVQLQRLDDGRESQDPVRALLHTGVAQCPN